MCRSLSTIVLLLVPAMAIAQPPVRSARRPAVEQRTVSPAELARLRNEADYQPISRDELARLLSRQQTRDPATGSAIEHAMYSAHLNGTVLTQGTITLKMDPPTAGSSRPPVTSLGASSLQNIQLSSAEQKLELATNSQGELISLGAPTSEIVTGTWTAEGEAVGQSTVFQLRLPLAAVCDFTIYADPDIVINSPNALVVRGTSTNETSEWILYPQTPTSITISCTSRSESLRNESIGLTVMADYRFRRFGGNVTWTIGVPQSLTNAALQFSLAPGCSVQAVTLSNDTSLDWTTPADSDTGLQVRLPPSPAGLNLSIEADIAGTLESTIAVPFLAPGSWQPETAEPGGSMVIRSGELRVMVAPEIVVTDVHAEGASESDIEYAPDGSQILKMVQFSQRAQVSLLTIPSTAVVDDAVVVQEFSDDGRADAYVSVLVRAGFVGTLQWSVPTSWRVTDVVEVGTRSPLLYHISDTLTDQRSSLLEVTLRTPLTAGGVQNLLIRLQSTGGQLNAESPVLISADYHRQQDFVVPIGAGNTQLKQAGVTSTALADLEKLLPWLPAGELTGTAAYRRSELPTVSGPTLATNEGMVAAVDYSVTANRNFVQEFLRLNLRGRSELPSRIPLKVTSGADLRLSEDSVTQPPPVLRRESSGRRTDEWVLELPSGSSTPYELDVLLTAFRPLTSTLPVTMLEVPQARHEGGIIQPPAADANVVLTMADNKPLLAPQPYPPKPLEFAARLLPDAADAPPQVVSGNAFVMLRRVADSLQVRARYRLLIRSPKAAPQLLLACDAVESVLVFIDGQHVFAEQTGDRFRIPLSEQQEDSTIDIFLTSFPIPHNDQTFQVPTMTFPEAGSVQVATFVLPPAEHVPAAPSATAMTTITATEPVTQLLNQTTSSADQSSNTAFYNEQQQFSALWKLTTARSGVAYLITSKHPTGTLTLRLYNTQFDVSIKIIAGLLVGLLWLQLLPKSRVAWWLAAISLLIMAAWQSGLTPLWRPILSGAVYGTTIAGLLCILQNLKTAPRSLHLTVSDPAVVLSGLAIFLSASQAFGFQDSSGQPQVLIPEGPLPVVYAQKSWLESMRQATQPHTEDALVVRSNVEVTLRSIESASATIVCEVATEPDEASGLILPLVGVTLVDCLLDGQEVFPTRRSSGETMISIPPLALVSADSLGGAATAAQSPGPQTIGNSLLRTVQYTVRFVPQSAPGLYRLAVPHPPSPQTNINLQDPNQILSTAWLPNIAAADRRVIAEPLQLPTLFNTRSVEINVALKDADVAPLNEQTAEVTCRAEVRPARTRLVTEYRVTPADARSTEVHVGRNRRYRVVSVESAAGQKLPWAVQNEQFSIQISPDTNGVQHFKIQLETETAISLRQQISVSRLATVNGVRTPHVKLQTNTSELFFVSGVTSEGRLLEQQLTGIPAADIAGNSDSGLYVPPNVKRIEVALERRLATREARLVQKVTVHESDIEWSCRCEIDISGQPVFRQILKISPNVRISEISARNGEVARLQSWTRNGELVIVSLREATRGSLVVNAKGTVVRQPGTETQLPIIGLPESVEILGSSLELSAGSESDFFISDLAGNVPDSPIAIQTTPIPRNPVRMSVTDEQRPLVIRANPDKRILATGAAVLYDSDGRTLLAQFLTLKTPDAAFSAPFSLPNTAAFATCKTWVGQDAEFHRTEPGRGQAVIRIPPESEPQVVIAVTDIVPARDNEVLSVPVPNFDADVRVESFQAFDVRDPKATGSLPNWLQAAIRKTPTIPTTSAAEIVEAGFNAAKHQVQIRLPVSSQPTDAGSPRGGVVYCQTDHDLNLNHSALLTGTSGFLTFALQDNVIANVSIPRNTIVTQVTVNGTALPFAVSNGAIQVPTQERVSCIELTWGRDISEAARPADSAVPLPRMLCPQTSTSTRVVQSARKSWKLPDIVRDTTNITEDRLRAITTGLQLIDSDTLSDDAATTELPEYLKSLPPSPVWQQLDSESSTATQAFGRLLLAPDATNRPAVYVQPNDSGAIRLTSSSPPSLLTGLAVLSALMLFVTPIMGQRQRPTVTRHEASTVVTEPGASTTQAGPQIEPDTIASISRSDSHI